MGMWLRESQWSLTFEVRKRLHSPPGDDGSPPLVAMEPDL